jgi:hypothetical protein
MAETLVWPLLFKGVIDVFAEDGFQCENAFGWTQPFKVPLAPGTRKISWVPGDEKGDAGKLAPPVHSEGDRALATFVEQFQVYCWAVDQTDPSELAQYRAARNLYDLWFRALWHAAATVGTLGRFAVVSHTWETNKKVRAHGACLRVLCTVQAKVSDTPYLSAPLDLAAELTGQLDDPNSETGGAIGDVVETQTITKDDET